VSEAGIDRFTLGGVAGCVGAVAIEHAHAFAVAFVVALHFECASVGELVRECRCVPRAGPGPVTIFVAARETVERCEKSGAECRFPRFVRAVDHIEVGIEVERAVREFPEAVDTEALQFHGAISVPSNAASA
jgi:hypothetical protein